MTHHHDPAVLELEPLEVEAGLQAGTVTLLDIRSQALFERSGERAVGDRRFPADPDAAELASLDRERLIVAYCDCPGEAASFGFGTRLRRAGFPRVGVLRGGMAAWRSAGLPTERVVEADE